MQAPRIPSFFKAPKSKVFSFKPRYYDKRKEELEQLKNKSKRTKGMLFNRKETNRQIGNRSKRLVIVLIALFLLAYLLLS